MASPAARRRALHLFLLAACAALAPSLAYSAPQGLHAGSVAALLRVEAPQSPSILLHGTVPLVKGAWRPEQMVEPFVVLDHDGTPVLTQSEIVTRYPASKDGVAVAEVIARVTRPPGKKAGDELAYRVVYWPHDVASPPAPSITALVGGPWSVPASVQALLKNPQGVLIELVDVFGNSYRVAPFDGTGKLLLLKHGPVQTQLKVSQTLRPTPPVGGPFGTLPHHLGVHVYLTVSAQDEIVGFDVRFHNAHSGHNATNPMDDPLGKVYFRSINLYVPAPWFFVQDFLDPYLSAPTGGESGYLQFPLVKEPAGGAVHGMRWQQQFHRRLSLAPVDKIQQAQDRARGEGLAFATRGKDPVTGHAYWSWWNPQTARWFPQSHRLPSLDHVGDAKLDLHLANERDMLQYHLESGTSAGPITYPISSPVLGYAHPYGTAYGGMTGGLDIYLYDGLPTLEAASLAGYQAATLTHRMQSDRMPNVLYDADGTPSTVAEWLQSGWGGSYVPFEHFVTPILKPQDPFGLHAAPTFQADFVESYGLAAPWVQALFEYTAYDFQHLVRYTRVAKTLAWMANDSLAKDDVTAQADVFHLSYHEYPNSDGGYIQSTGLLWDINAVAQYGPVGLAVGRGEGWGIDCAAAAYALGTPQWRSTNRPWLDEIAKVIADGQVSCSGFIQAEVNGKFFDGKYRGRQIIEQSILENALVGLDESVYRGAAAGMSAMINTTLKKSLYSMLSPMSWTPSQHAPWAITAVGPVGGPPWCSITQVPPDGHSSYVDAFQNWSSFAYGFERTGNVIFLLAAQYQIGGDLLASLLAQGSSNVQNKAALLALCQSFIGMGL